MGTTPVLLRNAIDVYVNNGAPNSNTGVNYKTLHVVADTTLNRHFESLLYFGLPFNKGVTIISAKLRLMQIVNATGTKTVNVRRVTQAWSASRVTFNTRPTHTATNMVTVAKTNSLHGTQWEWDVTAMMQTISNGAPWYGFIVYGTNPTTHPFGFASSAATGLLWRPVLELTWKDNPKTPTQLSPSAGRQVSVAKPILQCDFTDYAGDTSMDAIHVRIFTTLANANLNTPSEWDSGEVATSEPELNLNATAYAGIPAAATRWWRVRVKDGAGLWSGWSAPAEFGRTTKGVLTLTNPSGTVVSDATFPVTWTFTGRTQRAYQISLPITNTSRNYWTSGKITSTDNTMTIPAGVIKDSAIPFRFSLRVWDTIDRESTPNDAAYSEVVKDLSFVYDATVNPVVSLVGTSDSTYCNMVLTWTRSAMPDKWDIYRDGKILASLPGVELFVSGTSYKYSDFLPQPRKQSTWVVVAVVNGKGSASNPSIVRTVTPRTFVLSDELGSDGVLIFNPEHEMALDSTTAVHTPAGDGSPILLTQGEHGYVGQLNGTIEANPLVPALTSQEWRDKFLSLSKNNGRTLCLTMIDRSFKCFIDQVKITPRVNGNGVYYDVSFNFYQTDWVE